MITAFDTIEKHHDARYTYADYYAIQDDKRYEVHEGKLMMVPAPVTYHQRISRKIERILDAFVTENDLGEIFYAPTDVVLADDVVVQPDILFISKERAAIISEKAIEVLTFEGGLYKELDSAKDEGKVRSKILNGLEVDIKDVF